MKTDKIKVFIFELLLTIILFFALFASNILTRSILSIIILIYTFIAKKSLRKRKANSINQKQITILMFVFALVYLGAFYLLGLYFGYVKSKIILSIWSIFRIIIPLTIIIICSEIIRKIFLTQECIVKIKSLRINISEILTYFSMVLIDLLIYTGVYDLTNLDNFLTLLGFVFFASLSCNLLYNYISARYGYKGIIIYRLITILFGYIIPIIPNVYIFFRSFLRMLYPYLIFLILDKLYMKNEFVISYSSKKKEFIGTTVLFIVITLIIMLISCQFKYGILVVGSKSMTGTLNKGDAVIFEAYDNQEIKKGQVIVFDYNDIDTIHRVVRVRRVNNEVRYYTKGDNNNSMDKGYITSEDVKGLVHLRIKYIGFPTLWIRSLFS